MSRRIVIFALALMAAGCVTINDNRPAPPVAAYAGPLVKRTALVVSSIEQSLTLYRDILGFQPGPITRSQPTSYSYEVFAIPRDIPIRFVTLDSGPNQTRSLAMIEAPGAPRPQGGVRPVSLVINANGRFQAIMAAVAARGLTVIAPRPLPSATQGEGIEGAFVDFDGHLIVVYEFPNPDPANRM